MFFEEPDASLPKRNALFLFSGPSLSSQLFFSFYPRPETGALPSRHRPLRPSTACLRRPLRSPHSSGIRAPKVLKALRPPVRIGLPYRLVPKWGDLLPESSPHRACLCIRVSAPRCTFFRRARTPFYPCAEWTTFPFSQLLPCRDTRYDSRAPPNITLFQSFRLMGPIRPCVCTVCFLRGGHPSVFVAEKLSPSCSSLHSWALFLTLPISAGTQDPRSNSVEVFLAEISAGSKPH